MTAELEEMTATQFVRRMGTVCQTIHEQNQIVLITRLGRRTVMPPRGEAIPAACMSEAVWEAAKLALAKAGSDNVPTEQMVVHLTSPDAHTQFSENVLDRTTSGVHVVVEGQKRRSGEMKWRVVFTPRAFAEEAATLAR